MTPTRREFLRRASAGAAGLAGSLFLDACARQGLIETIPPAASPASATALPTLTPGPLATPVPIEPTAATSLPQLVIARGGEPADRVERSLAALGGIERFVPAGANVIIKPNICVAYHTYEYAATTNPWVVGALVRLCLGAGVKAVRVMDMPFGGTQEEAYARSGIRAEVEAAGGSMEYMPDFKYRVFTIQGASSLKKTEVYEDILTADVLINVPIAKQHSASMLTLGLKNLMGTVKDRDAMHFNLYQRIVDLASLVRPTLNVVDATRILVNNGPTGGDLADVKQLDTLIASTDIVAADAWAASLFDLRPRDVPYFPLAEKIGLGTADLSQVLMEEIAVDA